MRWIGNLLTYGGMYVVYMGSFGASQFTLPTFLFHCVLGAPLVLGGQAIANRVAGEEQEGDDKNASKIAETFKQSADSPPGRYFLYLRPFASTNQFKLPDAHLNFFSWDLWQRDGHDDMERILAKALKPTAPLIALGAPGEHRGAGRVATTEEGWREDVGRFARGASLIVVIPSANPGTRWEMELLKREQLLMKCIFVAPPLEDGHYKVPLGAQQQWSDAEKACAEIGLQIPPRSLSGQIFKCAANGDVVHAEVLPFPEPTKWMEALQRAIDA